MNLSIICYFIGYVLRIEGVLMLLPAIVGAAYGEKQCYAFFAVAALTFLIGFALTFKRDKNQAFYAKEGFVAVALSWIALSLFGCLPFIFSGDIPRFADAFFETVSGFTTTGSSILSDVEALSQCSLLWRSFSHWIGGMGVLVFLLMILPTAGGSAMHLLEAESPGPQVGKTVPKLRESARILYIIYTVMTVVEIVILLCGGMPLFDAVTLSFGTAGTGGFAIKSTGLAEYSAFSQYVIAAFMILFGVNFNVYYLILIRKVKQAAKSEEVWWYFSAIALAVLTITLNTRQLFVNMEESFRSALFHVGSIITTTGYATYDFNNFPQLSKTILLGLMFMGACAGSTGGGIKVSRIIILLKSARDELARIVHPRAVRRVRLDGKPIEAETFRSVHAYMMAYIALFVVSMLLISVDDFDMTTNFSAVTAAINNIGPGFNVVGPMGSFGGFSDVSKYVFCFDMLAGRLELFPMLVLINPGTWRRALRRGRK